MSTSTATRRLPLVLLFSAIVVDGFDTAALSFVIPTLGLEWGMAPAAFTLALGALSVGSVVGYLVCGRLVARFGRAWVVWASVAFFSISTAATAAVTTIPALTATRLLTGVGLGTIVPAAVSLTADLVPRRNRESATVLVVLGMALGAILGGVTAGPVIATLGWRAVFWIAAALAAGLALVLRWKLELFPSPSAGTEQPPAKATVGVLFVSGLRSRTTALWTFSFLVLLVSQTINMWLPTFLGEFGFSPDSAPLGTAVWGVGGLLGGVVLAATAMRFGTPRVLIVLSVLAAAFLTLVAVTPLPAPGGVLIALALAGAGVSAGPAGQAAMAVGIYDSARTVGVAWSTALGRIGSIAGPALCGLLMAVGLSGRTILLLAAVPMLLAAVAAVPLTRPKRSSRHHRRWSRDDATPAEATS